VSFDPATGGVQAVREQRLGAIRLASGPDSDADPSEIAAALVEGVRKHGLALLPWSEAAKALRQRAAYAGDDELSDAALIARLDEWLPPLVEGKRRLSDIAGGALFQALENLIGWEGKSRLDREAPAYFTSPLGTTHAIDYAAEGGPAVELRVQALFGLSAHPMVGRTPLVLRLTSPAGRPIQTTRDLPGFWKGSWAAVAKEMRGRYPRHPWPEDPTQADPTLRTKKASGR
jgi:ATP-dependent helicase HrpB